MASLSAANELVISPGIRNTGSRLAEEFTKVVNESKARTT